MALTPRRLHLVDVTALRRADTDTRAEAVLHTLVSLDVAALCEPVALELLYSARDTAEYTGIADSLDRWRWLHTTEEAMREAMRLQRALADRGAHRFPIRRLLVAATARVHDAFLVHHHRDYDLLREVTGQPTAWVSPDD